jgi:phage shock protein E
MKKNYHKYILIGAIFIGISFFIFYTMRCHGDECNIERNKIKSETMNFTTNPKIIKEKVLNNEILLLDAREESEWQEGHIEGALLLPLGEINEERTKEIDKDEIIYIYCRSGRRAIEALSKMRQLGFDNVFNLGGIIDWQKNGGEVIKD